MRTLIDFVDDQNRWNTLFGDTAITFPLTQTTVDSIARSLDQNLSPENLHCDGEISVAEANRKYRFYAKVYRELEQYCAKNRLNTPMVYEL
jgi:hypothetical protein